MRLKEKEIQAIKTVIHAMDAGARIFLFGSRVDDTQRGGDIDLLILSAKLAERDKRALRIGLCNKLGEQKIDLVIARDASRPFVQMAVAEGKAL